MGVALGQGGSGIAAFNNPFKHPVTLTVEIQTEVGSSLHICSPQHSLTEHNPCIPRPVHPICPYTHSASLVMSWGLYIDLYLLNPMTSL